MALKPWAERCAESAGPPQKMRIQSANSTIGGNSPTMVYGLIENTPGNTPMNKAIGPVRKMAGAYSRTGQNENPYEWINTKDISCLGAYIGVDR